MSAKILNSVVVIGSGNLAEALSRALDHSPHELRQIFARNATRGAEVARLAHTTWTDNPAHLAPADLYIIAVSDCAVASVAASLPLPAEAVVAHTAGCVSLEVLPTTQRAVFYPFQTFTQGREVDFADIPIFIEASTPALQASLEEFARSLSHTVRYADSDLRAHIHLSGVFACNFANHLFACGAQTLHAAGLSYDILRPLIRETTAKALAAADPATVQTGPAVRGDRATQQHHCTLLAADPTLETIYQTISQHIWETSKKI
ncbi:MAG: Rossmann-like and DUF2520 domain-containing protein [Alistipes sp.]